jgi:hypothetical protein
VGTQYEGDAQRFFFIADQMSYSGLSDEPYIRFTEQSGNLAPDVSLIHATEHFYQATARFPGTLSAGRHQGQIRVDACNNQTCSEIYGSRILPYDITVLPGQNLTPLNALPGGSDWKSWGGNAGHSGYVPVSLNPQQFSVRWTRVLPHRPAEMRISDAVTAQGHVIFNLTPMPANGVPAISGICALREFDGELAWSVTEPSGSPLTFSALATDGVTVWALRPGLSGGGPGASKSSSLDWIAAANGAVYYQVLYPSYQLPPIGEPVFDNGQVLTCGVDYWPGSMEPARFAMAYNAYTGVKQWSQGVHSYRFTADSDSFYAYPAGTVAAYGLRVSSRATGDEVRVINDSQVRNNGVSRLVAADGHVVVSDGGLIKNFDPAGAIRWQIPADHDGWYLPPVAIAKGAVYIAQAGIRLTVHSALTGAELWSWTPAASDHEFHPDTFLEEGTPVAQPIVTDTHVFVSTMHGIHAIDLVTHRSVWFYPHPANMSISANGVLYLMRLPLNGPEARSDGYITAVNLH